MYINLGKALKNMNVHKKFMVKSQWRQKHGTEPKASLLYIHIMCKAKVT